MIWVRIRLKLLFLPGTLAIQRRCDEQTWKDSRTSAGLFASITVTLLKYVIALKYWQLGNIYKSTLSSKKDGINFFDIEKNKLDF